MLWLAATSCLLSSAAELAASLADWLLLPPGVTRVECVRAQRKLKELLQDSRPAQQSVLATAEHAASSTAHADSGEGSKGDDSGKKLEQWGSHRIFLSLSDMSDKILHYASSSVTSSPRLPPK